MMSIPKTELVLKAAEMAEGGEIFVLKMPALRLGDLVDTLIEELALKYGYEPTEIREKIIGKRAGEKSHEALMTEEEAENAYENEEMFVVLPQTLGIMDRLSHKLPDNFKKIQKREYSSKAVKLLTKEEIKSLLTEFISLPI